VNAVSEIDSEQVGNVYDLKRVEVEGAGLLVAVLGHSIEDGEQGNISLRTFVKYGAVDYFLQGIPCRHPSERTKGLAHRCQTRQYPLSGEPNERLCTIGFGERGQ
jgi:hypothetical protein